MKKGNNEGSIRKRANGTWEGRYSDGRNDNGRQIQRSVYGKTRKEVAEKINAINIFREFFPFLLFFCLDIKIYLLQ